MRKRIAALAIVMAVSVVALAGCSKKTTTWTVTCLQAPSGVVAMVSQKKKLYDDILADKDVDFWLKDTILLEVDTMSKEDVEAHIGNVKNVAKEYKDIVAR